MLARRARQMLYVLLACAAVFLLPRPGAFIVALAVAAGAAVLLLGILLRCEWCGLWRNLPPVEPARLYACAAV